MKCYYVENGKNFERWFFSSKAAAQKFAREKDKEDSTNNCFVDELNWLMTKAGIITLLDTWACNGETVSEDPVTYGDKKLEELS